MHEAVAAQDLAAYLRELKERTGRSYTALARRLDLSSSALHRYCSGDGVPPDFSLVERFARECGADAGEMAELHRRWARLMAARQGRDPGGQPEDRALAHDTRPMVATSGRLSVSEPVRSGSRVPPARRGHSAPPPDEGPSRRRNPLLLGGVAAALALGSVPAVLYLRADSGAPSGGVRATIDPRARCVERGSERHVDQRLGGHVWTTDYVCPNRRAAPLYLDERGSIKVATMDTTRSWFLCWTPGRVHRGGGNVWYYTRGDRVEGGTERVAGWGFMASDDVTVPSHPWPGMPRCGFGSTGDA